MRVGTYQRDETPVAMAAIVIASIAITVLLQSLTNKAPAAPPVPQEQPVRKETRPPVQRLVFPPDCGEYEVLVYRVIDGDTVAFYWLVPDVGRIAGVNCPERKGATREAGERAREFTLSKVPGRPTEMTIIGREKYGRALIDFRTTDDKSIRELLLESGNAVPYP